ncbi:MAG: hypothetical protein JXR66_01110 [Bacteroidales bacterium]|nr:hypothetical protein [Bacteroidales bacterium]
MRKTVGWIGILLPFVLIAGTLILSGEDPVRKNISLYYHSEMRDVFVGALCAIALFLFFYTGYDKWDDRAGNLAGFFALGVAFFPTVREGPYDISAWIHFFSAACFFLVLSVFSLFLFTRKESSPSKRKIKRNIIYRICGYVMIVCLVSIIIFMIFLEGRDRQSDFVFWAETIALIAFGTSWLTKGGTLYPDIENGKMVKE